MRLYLSSFRLGNRPDQLLRLLDGRTRTAVILNADDYKSRQDRYTSRDREFDDLRAIGLEPSEIDLREYFDKPSEVKERLSTFDLLWVRGGNGFILRRALRQSGADAVISDLLAKDAIAYGGYSAGICILTPSLQGIELVDDPDIIPEGYDPRVIWECLGVLPYHVLPHYKSDHPESAAIDKSVEYLIDKHVLFLALRDGEAIVRDGDQETVVS